MSSTGKISADHEFTSLSDGRGRADGIRPRDPRLGYVLVVTAATLWALNGSLGRFLLDDHLPPARLAELRALGTFALLGAGLAAANRSALKIAPRDLPQLALLGIIGFAGVSALYFAAIARLDVGVALTIQYLGPLLLLLWLRVVHRRRLARGIWLAAAAAAVGCLLIVRAYHPGSLDLTGVLEAFGAAVTFAIYLFTAEQAGHRHPSATILTWGFGLAALFWLFAQPIWTFPWHLLHTPRNLVLAAYVVVGGTLLPFGCMVVAVRHLPASRAAVVATLEPVLGAILAWPIHGQALGAVQITGGLLTIAAIVWVQARRSDLEAELAPASRRDRRNPRP